MKEIKPVTIATYQILTARRKGEYAHLALLDALDWGLVIYDEVHLLPAPVFKLTAELQARRRLGLTATLVREDGREGDVFSLIGPKRFDAPWKELEAEGFISPRSAPRCGSTFPEFERLEYASAPDDERYRLAATAPEKLKVVKQLVERHKGERILVIGQYLDQLDYLAEALDAPQLNGSTPIAERERLYQEFRDGVDEAAGGVEGRELLGGSAGGDRRHPGVRVVRVTPGGGAAPGTAAAAEGERAARELLHAGRPRHRRPGLRAEPPALPRRAGLQLHDHRRGRVGGGLDAVFADRAARVPASLELSDGTELYSGRIGEPRRPGTDLAARRTGHRSRAAGGYRRAPDPAALAHHRRGPARLRPQSSCSATDPGFDLTQPHGTGDDRRPRDAPA